VFRVVKHPAMIVTPTVFPPVRFVSFVVKHAAVIDDQTKALLATARSGKARRRLAAELGLLERPEPTFVCPRCGHASRFALGVRGGYCGRCADWTRRPAH